MRRVLFGVIFLSVMVAGSTVQGKNIIDVMDTVCTDKKSHMVAFVPGSVTPIELGTAEAGSDMFWDTGTFENLCVNHKKIVIAHCPAKGDPLPLIPRPTGVSLQLGHFSTAIEMLYRNTYAHRETGGHESEIYHILYNHTYGTFLEFGLTALLQRFITLGFEQAKKDGVFKAVSVGEMSGTNGVQVRYVIFPVWFQGVYAQLQHHYVQKVERYASSILEKETEIEKINPHNMLLTVRLLSTLLDRESKVFYFTKPVKFRYELATE